MLLGTSESLEELLVRILAERRLATVAYLREEVSRTFRPLGVPAIYKELRKLEDHGVIYRRGKEVGLSLAWILNLTSLTDRMCNFHVESPELSDVLPADGERKTFRFSSLERLDDFWIHAIILMAQHSKSKKLFQWFPHPWFNLIHSEKSFPFQQALKAGRNISGEYRGRRHLARSPGG